MAQITREMLEAILKKKEATGVDDMSQSNNDLRFEKAQRSLRAYAESLVKREGGPGSISDEFKKATFHNFLKKTFNLG